MLQQVSQTQAKPMSCRVWCPLVHSCRAEVLLRASQKQINLIMYLSPTRSPLTNGKEVGVPQGVSQEHMKPEVYLVCCT